MTRAASRAVVAMKIFMEQQTIAPVWIGVHSGVIAEYGAPSVLIARVNADKPLLQFRSDLGQCHHAARAGRAFDLEVIAEIPIENLQTFDHQIIERHPDRATP